MYNYKTPIKSSIRGIQTIEGETIEQKLVRIMNNKEPIKDGAPLIYTERKDGVQAGSNTLVPSITNALAFATSASISILIVSMSSNGNS